MSRQVRDFLSIGSKPYQHRVDPTVVAWCYIFSYCSDSPSPYCPAPQDISGCGCGCVCGCCGCWRLVRRRRCARSLQIPFPSPRKVISTRGTSSTFFGPPCVPKTLSECCSMLKLSKAKWVGGTELQGSQNSQRPNNVFQARSDLVQAVRIVTGSEGPGIENTDSVIPCVVLDINHYVVTGLMPGCILLQSSMPTRVFHSDIVWTPASHLAAGSSCQLWLRKASMSCDTELRQTSSHWSLDVTGYVCPWYINLRWPHPPQHGSRWVQI